MSVVSTKASRLRHLLRVSLGHAEIGDRIRRARDQAGLTQRELAERIGIKNAQSISRYERGETEVPIRRLQRIAEATRLPMSFFAQDPEEEQAARSGLEDRLDRIEKVLEELVVRLG